MFQQQEKTMKKGKAYILGAFKLAYTAVVNDLEDTKKDVGWEGLKINRNKKIQTY